MDTDSSIRFDEKYIISLTPEMFSQIRDSDELIFRFYFGPVPATFRIEGKRMKAIKEVFKS